MQPPHDNANTINRRTLLAGTTAAGLLGLLPRDGNSQPVRDFRLSLSVSPFTEEVLAKGITFTDGHREARSTEDIQRLFVDHGATEVYARIGTLRKFTPGNGDHGVERGLERARLAKKLGLPFNPEIGLFASYGDVTNQPAPDFKDYPQLKNNGDWHTLKIDQMTPILHDYGALIATEILATGVKVNYWDLGNEVELGVAGVAMNTSGSAGYKAPDAIDPEIGKMTLLRLMRMPEVQRADWLAQHLWPHTGRMFAAVAGGIRSVDKSARFSTHLSGMGIYWPKLAAKFYEVHGENGYLPDQLASSFYPTGNTGHREPFGRMKETVTLLNETFKRPVFIAEFGYPASTKLAFGGGTWTNPIPGYPVSPEGQANFTHDVVTWGVKTGYLAGIRPWAPDFVGIAWGAMAYFDLQDKIATTRPGLDAFRDALRGSV